MLPRLALVTAAAASALAACTPAGDKAPTASETPVSGPAAQPAPPSDGSTPEPGATRPSPEPAAEDECGANKVGGYVSQLPSTDTMARIKAAIGHDRIRTIKPGDAVTMDFRPDRLNVEVGEDGRIKVVRCG